MSAPGAAGVWIVDRVVLRPGQLRAWRELFERDYLPGARERGMSLVGHWVSPPLELADRQAEVLAVWSLPDAEAFWPARIGGGADPDVARFWEEAGALIARRERSYFRPAAEVLDGTAD